jgi:hypothetical protein
VSESIGNGKVSMGVQAYRWLVALIMFLLTGLSARVLVTIDKTAEKVDTLQIQLIDMKGTLDSRINAHVQRLDDANRRFDTIDRRNDSQDVKIDALQQRVWRMPEGRTP